MKPIFKFFSVILLIFCSVYQSSAQTLTWNWARSASSNSGSVSVNGLGSDAEGNAYTLGATNSGIGFGSLPYLSGMMYLVKHTPQGVPVWAIQANCSPAAMAVDLDGNSYITGKFKDTLDFGGHVLVCRGKVDAFLAKVDSSGAVLWARQSGGIGNPHLPNYPSIMEDEGISIGIDTAGNSYVGILVEATDTSAVIFDSLSIFPPYPSLYPTLFNVLAKYNPAGDIQWVRSINNSYFDRFNITISNKGNCYISGIFIDSLDYENNMLTSNGSDDVYLASYDLNGNFLWVQSFGGSGYDHVSDIITDRHGNLFMAGVFTDSVQIGSTTLIMQPGSSSMPNSAIFLAKFNRNGNAMWASQTNGASTVGDSYIAIDSSGNSYLHSAFMNYLVVGSSQFQSFGNALDLLISKWDSMGNFTWAVAPRGSGNDFPKGITLGPNATSLYVAGGFRYDLNLGNNSLIGNQNYSFFLSKLDNIVSSTPAKMQSAGFKIYPNPVLGAFHVLLPGQNFNSGKFLLYSGTGQLVKEVTFSNATSLLVERGSLPAGLYIYMIQTEGKIAGAGKIVLE